MLELVLQPDEDLLLLGEVSDYLLLILDKEEGEDPVETSPFLELKNIGATSGVKGIRKRNRLRRSW